MSLKSLEIRKSGLAQIIRLSSYPNRSEDFS